MSETSSNDDIEITYEMMEAVAMAQLYRRDELNELRKVVSGSKKLTNDELKKLHKQVLLHPDFEIVKQDTVKVETCTLVDDNVDTITLMYNELLRDARFEKKYEVIIRILKELQKLKSISDEETKFEIIIDVKKPDE